jgi:acetate kinase
MKILVLNAGSSSHKFSLYEFGVNLPGNRGSHLWEAKVDWHDDELHGSALEDLIRRLWSGEAPILRSPSEIDAVGHRIVHGGPRYEEPVRITPAVKDGIAGSSEFAPLHNRAELEGIEVVERLLGEVPQIAVFDTGFHRRMPLASAIYPGPYEWFTKDIRRYGFHGINHQYCAARAAEMLQRDLASLKLVSCHLGNGCSLAAIQHGRSVDTTMGFTPLEGLMMGTRSGTVDPGMITYLLRHGHLKANEIDDVLNRQSGLLGISGVAADMRKTLASMKQGHSRAQLAFDIYVHRLQAGIGAMVAVLGESMPSFSPPASGRIRRKCVRPLAPHFLSSA